MPEMTDQPAGEAMVMVPRVAIETAIRRFELLGPYACNGASTLIGAAELRCALEASEPAQAGKVSREGMLTDDRLAEIAARANAAVPGPWQQLKELPTWIDAPNHCERGALHICDVRGWGHLTGKGHGAHGMEEKPAMAIQDANGAFIAHAREDIPALLAHIRALALRANREE